MPRLLRSVARTAAIAGTATAVSGRVQRRQARRFAEPDYQQTADAAPTDVPEPAYPAAAPPTPDRLAQLSRLGELRTQGVLTEEQFAHEKAGILGD